MKIRSFQHIATTLTDNLRPLLQDRLTPEELHYYDHTPIVQRNLRRRITLALAETFLQTEQTLTLKDIALEQEQTTLEDLPS